MARFDSALSSYHYRASAIPFVQKDVYSTIESFFTEAPIFITQISRSLKTLGVVLEIIDEMGCTRLYLPEVVKDYFNKQKTRYPVTKLFLLVFWSWLKFHFQGAVKSCEYNTVNINPFYQEANVHKDLCRRHTSDVVNFAMKTRQLREGNFY